MIINQNNKFAASRLRPVLCFLFLISAAVAALAALASLGVNSPGWFIRGIGIGM